MQVLQGSGITVVPETNELMTGSYGMLDARGRFFSNASGAHAYGPSIFEARLPGTRRLAGCAPVTRPPRVCRALAPLLGPGCLAHATLPLLTMHTRRADSH